MSGSALVASPSSMARTTSVGAIRWGAPAIQLLSAYYRAETLLAVESTDDGGDRRAAAYARHLVPRYWHQVQGVLAEMVKELEVAANEDS